MSDAFGIMVGCAGFVLGVAYGMQLGRSNRKPAKKGDLVPDRRYRQLWVIDPLLEVGPSLEREHITIIHQEHV